MSAKVLNWVGYSKHQNSVEFFSVTILACPYSSFSCDVKTGSSSNSSQSSSDAKLAPLVLISSTHSFSDDVVLCVTERDIIHSHRPDTRYPPTHPTAIVLAYWRMVCERVSALDMVFRQHLIIYDSSWRCYEFPLEK